MRTPGQRFTLGVERQWRPMKVRFTTSVPTPPSVGSRGPRLRPLVRSPYNPQGGGAAPTARPETGVSADVASRGRLSDTGGMRGLPLRPRDVVRADENSL
ncbi:hypothetical protein GCM10014715_11070 [Streptomyces spiralis]|uniref:Uncharacterized protein n=1 Tax=Streptomyces spiralis TaxID=66376 RepID=A0A919DNB0_9ACTN|nr:hypothetical protein GCM10014715_11070 [Streptomyces spiralis]